MVVWMAAAAEVQRHLTSQLLLVLLAGQQALLSRCKKGSPDSLSVSHMLTLLTGNMLAHRRLSV